MKRTLLLGWLLLLAFGITMLQYAAAKRTLLFVLLLLLAFGITVLQYAAAPLPTVRHALPVTHLEQPHEIFLPDPMVVRAFGLNRPGGMDMLDQRAEVLFDN